MNNLQLLRSKATAEKLGISKATLYKRIQAGLIPAGVKIALQTTVWSSVELDAVIHAIMAGKSDDEMKAIVKLLVAERGAS
ncbi:hypothetical protein CXF85_19875 [Colwellia sp. 75C3]|uniref:helix-turn-helix transcriptional regulator n=1 Tax=Colwellia sp. 75C3 TaxID=888425 RepID=UPI000C349CEC|nr:AlpA family phage regulatory protein [Colwellia sp. 75C3]PKG81024.1 hypothetical protein CXF85_19875 [Colwellia sp. 75C3]